MIHRPESKGDQNEMNNVIGLDCMNHSVQDSSKTTVDSDNESLSFDIKVESSNILEETEQQKCEIKKESMAITTELKDVDDKKDEKRFMNDGREGLYECVSGQVKEEYFTMGIKEEEDRTVEESDNDIPSHFVIKMNNSENDTSSHAERVMETCSYNDGPSESFSSFPSFDQAHSVYGCKNQVHGQDADTISASNMSPEDVLKMQRELIECRQIIEMQRNEIEFLKSKLKAKTSKKVKSSPMLPVEVRRIEKQVDISYDFGEKFDSIENKAVTQRIIDVIQRLNGNMFASPEITQCCRTYFKSRKDERGIKQKHRKAAARRERLKSKLARRKKCLEAKVKPPLSSDQMEKANDIIKCCLAYNYKQ